MATRAKKVERSGSQKWVRLGGIRVRDVAQRSLNEGKVKAIISEFDPDVLGIPIVNFINGDYWTIDGQHRIEALKRWLGDGWEDQQILCHVYENLPVKEEADKFDRHNDTKVVSTYDKFRIRVTAGREVETKIKNIVEDCGLVISRDKSIDGAIPAVGTLRKIYLRTGGDNTLSRSLLICKEAYGDAGLEASVMDGISHLCQRYNGVLVEKVATRVLADMHGGVHGLLNRAEVLRKSTGSAKSVCIAAAAVERYNKAKPRGTKPLPSWWS